MVEQFSTKIYIYSLKLNKTTLYTMQITYKTTKLTLICTI